MGVCSSREVRQQIAINQFIEQQLVRDHTAEKNSPKLLLLGTGECGKSTILKQMQILHKNGFNETEIENKRLIIYSNIVAGMSAMLRAMEHLGLRFVNSANNVIHYHCDANTILQLTEDDRDYMGELDDDIYMALKSLWADANVKRCYERRNEYQLADSVKYFLDALDRIHVPNYRPTDQDILYSRIPTTGAVQLEFTIKETTFRVFDVGGQRSQRRKWIHFFDNVNAIIYISAINEFDQKLREDGKSNRMKESMALFEMICNSRLFLKASMVLFLNKKDIFQEKLRVIPITQFFDDFPGSDAHAYEECVNWVSEKFETLNKVEGRKTYVHATCATDTKHTQKVIDSAVDTVFTKNMRHTGMH